MRILLSDGSGLTARQSATLLAEAGHHVEALSPEPVCLCRFTRHVRAVHRVPAFGADPFGWLDAALAIAERRRVDLLLPAQEQVAVLALAADRLRDAGVRTVAPDFSALVQVQDKVAAFATLDRLGIPQPRAAVVGGRPALEQFGAAPGSEWSFPLFVKTPVGTASSGVRRVASAAELRDLAARHEADGLFGGAPGDGSVLVQEPVDGTLHMAQSVFAHSELAAFHACERVKEGASGGASHKRSADLPEVREHLRTLGAALGWHGALSADAMISPDGTPRFIDINPRLVEPVNAARSGVDLVGALVEIAESGDVARRPTSTSGVQTHQTLLALLGAAQRRGRRRDVAGELWNAVTHRGDYRDSAEELTPTRKDLRAAVPAALVALATTIRPAFWRHFTNSSVDAYSLTPAAWREIIAQSLAEPGSVRDRHLEAAADQAN